MNYLMAGIKGVENACKYSSEFRKLVNNYNKALNLDNNADYNNELIRQETGWFKDLEGKWKYEISDENKFNAKINLQPNTKYELIDIIEHNELFMLYDDLYKLNVEIIDLD